MKFFFAPLLVLSLVCVWGSGSKVRSDDAPVSREEFEKLRGELEALRRGEPSAMAQQGPASEGDLPGGGSPVLGVGSGPGGSLYDKPFLRQAGGIQTHVGGYFDVEFMDRESRDHDFRLHRLVPFFVADLHERVRFATEIEIEDGSTVEVEFAALDLLLFEALNFRGGVILDPLGRFNLYHDSPYYDLVDRPLVNQLVIPTTLREPGAGIFGVIPTGTLDLDVKYEAYLTSGFKGLSDDPAADPAITRSAGLREARAHEPAFGTRRFGDNNNGFAGVGRVSFSPLLASELGVSAHHGTYDESGENDLTIAAVDALFTIPQFEIGDLPVGPMEILGEGAYAAIERNTFARSEGVPDDFWGYYTQVNYHFLPEYFLPRGTRVTTALFPESIFTLVGQWNQVNLDGDRRYRWTVGLNFRPVESTVIKLDYQFNRGVARASETADLDAFLVSLASYF